MNAPCTLPGFRSIQCFFFRLGLPSGSTSEWHGCIRFQASFSLFLLPECFLFLGARLEELSVQTLDELEGVIEQLSQWSSGRDTIPLLPKRMLFLFSKKALCHCQDQTVPCNFQCPSMLSLDPPRNLSLMDLVWYGHRRASLSQDAPRQMWMLLCSTSMALEFVHFSIGNLHQAQLHQTADRWFASPLSEDH